jgi:hypothetical protein
VIAFKDAITDGREVDNVFVVSTTKLDVVTSSAL